MQKIVLTILLLLGLSACTNNNNSEKPLPESQSIIAQGDGSFGDIVYGTNPIKSFVFTNDSSLPVTGNPVITGNGFDLALQLNCSLIEPGKSCLVKVIFVSSNKESGAYNAVLSVGDQQINLSATLPAVPSPSYIFSVNGISGSDIDLGEISGFNLKLLSIKIKNNSPKIGQNSVLSLSNSNFKILSNQCVKSLKPGQSCIAKVVVQGNNSNNLLTSQAFFDGQSVDISAQQEEINFNAQMVAVNSEITLGDFFEEGINKIQLLKIVNQGSGLGSINNIDLPPGYALGSNNCLNVKPGNSCVIRLIYSSSNLDKGSYTNTITIGDSEVDMTVNQVSKPNDLHEISIQIDENIPVNNCIPLNISLKDSENLNYVSSQSLSINSNIYFYSNSDCSNEDDLLLAPFQSSKNVFTKRNSAGAFNLILTIKDKIQNKNLFFYNPLEIASNKSDLVVGQTAQLSISGGKGPFTIEILTGDGSLSGNNYTANSVGSKIIRVTDGGLNQSATTSINVVNLLTTNVINFEKIVSQTQEIQVQGGLPPYTYSKVSGVGTIDTSGVYSANSAGTVDIKVKDSLNQELHILGTIYNNLGLSASVNNLVLSQNITLTTSGGKVPITLSVVSGGGSLAGNSYLADSTGIKVLKATDALGQTSQISVEVFSLLTAGVNNFERIVNQNYNMVANGGKTPYTYTIVSGVGTIDLNSGLYSSVNPGAVVVRVKDSLNQEVQVSGNIYSILDVSPKNQIISTTNNLTFAGVGGKLPYSFTKISGVGTINLTSGTYTSTQSGTAQILVTDALGQIASTMVTVNAPLTISAGTCSYSVPESMLCTVASSGGVGNKVFTTNQGLVNATTGEFKGQCINNLGQAIVTVSDALNNSASVSLSYPCAYPSCVYVLANGLGTASGLYWIDNDLNQAPDPIQAYCDMNISNEQGGWMLVSSNNTDSTTIPLTTNRQNQIYEMDRSGSLGTANPESDYIMGSMINNLDWSVVKVLGYGRNQVGNSAITINNRGNWAAGVWKVAETGSARLTSVTPRSNVTISGNVAINSAASYWVVDAVKLDRLNGGFTANKDQTTVGGAGVQVSSGDPTGGCYFGHGSTEESSYGEGWYDASSQANSKGFSTWVKPIYFYHAKGCADAKARGLNNLAGNTGSGLYTVDVDGYAYGMDPFNVYCDMDTTGYKSIGNGGTLLLALRTTDTTMSVVSSFSGLPSVTTVLADAQYQALLNQFSNLVFVSQSGNFIVRVPRSIMTGMNWVNNNASIRPADFAAGNPYRTSINTGGHNAWALSYYTDNGRYSGISVYGTGTITLYRGSDYYGSSQPYYMWNGSSYVQTSYTTSPASYSRSSGDFFYVYGY